MKVWILFGEYTHEGSDVLRVYGYDPKHKKRIESACKRRYDNLWWDSFEVVQKKKSYKPLTKAQLEMYRTEG